MNVTEIGTKESRTHRKSDGYCQFVLYLKSKRGINIKSMHEEVVM